VASWREILYTIVVHRWVDSFWFTSFLLLTPHDL